MAKRETYNQLGLKQTQNIEYKMQHTNSGSRDGGSSSSIFSC